MNSVINAYVEINFWISGLLFFKSKVGLLNDVFRHFFFFNLFFSTFINGSFVIFFMTWKIFLIFALLLFLGFVVGAAATSTSFYDFFGGLGIL